MFYLDCSSLFQYAPSNMQWFNIFWPLYIRVSQLLVHFLLLYRKILVLIFPLSPDIPLHLLFVFFLWILHLQSYFPKQDECQFIFIYAAFDYNVHWAENFVINQPLDSLERSLTDIFLLRYEISWLTLRKMILQPECKEIFNFTIVKSSILASWFIN